MLSLLTDPIEIIECDNIDVDNLPLNYSLMELSMVESLNNTTLDMITAPQIGIYKKAVLFRDFEGEKKFIVNPRIVFSGDQLTVVKETSSQYPYIPPFSVKRPEEVRVRFRSENGVETKTLDGKLSRLMQIAVDLFEGVDYKKRLSYIDRDKAKKLIVKYQRQK